MRIELRWRVVSPFGVASLIVPKYDIEPFDGAQDKFRGFTKFGIANSVNPFHSLSYPPGLDFSPEVHLWAMQPPSLYA